MKMKLMLVPIFILFFFCSMIHAQGLYVGVNYHPHDDKNIEKIKTDIQLMKDAGFNVVRMGHLAWDSYEPSEGVFDFAWFDEVMDLMSEAGIKVILDIAIRPAPLWLHHKYPSISITDEKGDVLYPNHRYMEDIGDPNYQKYALRFTDAMTKQYANHPALLAFGIDNMMRALVMDFAKDKQVLDINDQYMFGKSLLVCPVTRPMYSKIRVNGNDTINVEDFSKIKDEEVYLPKGTNWYDFWTGEKFGGGQTLYKETPLDIIPLYVRADSIFPMGPEVQYATEKKWDNLEIRIYPGANDEFTLYEDENDNYNYEQGAYSTITFKWDDEKKALTINDRQGSFPGMRIEHTFNIVLVKNNNGIGVEMPISLDKTIKYAGKEIVMDF